MISDCLCSHREGAVSKSWKISAQDGLTVFIIRTFNYHSWGQNAIVERDVGGVRGSGSGAVSVNVTIPCLGDDSMAAGKGAGKPTSPWDNMKIRFIVCFLGVFVCYFYYGILQETITRGDYGHEDKKEKFRLPGHWSWSSALSALCLLRSWFSFLRAPSRITPKAGSTGCVPSLISEPWCLVTLPFSMSTTQHRCWGNPASPYQWWSSVWQYWGRITHSLSTCVCCLLWVV